MRPLRPYQHTTINETRQAWREGHKNVIIESPTGSGKTVLSTNIFMALRERNRPSWFGVHRAELVDGTANTFRDEGLPFGIIAAGKHCNPDELIQIVSIPTAVNMLEELPKPYLIALDEGQHTGAASWQKVYNHAEWHLGLSGTPIMPGGKSLGAYYTKMIHGPTVPWLIDNEYLSRFEYYGPDVPDLSTVRSVGGEYSADQTEKIMLGKALVGNVVGHWFKHAGGKLTVGFAPTVKASKAYAQAFTDAGVPAAHIDGTTDPDVRRAIVQAFARREILVLFNVDLFGEGFDLSAIAGFDVTIEAMIMARPTKSLILCKQQWGRVLRWAAGKIAIILDHCGNWTRHGFPDDVIVWSLEAPPKRIIESGTTVAITQCPGCFAVFRPSAACPNCQLVREVKDRPMFFMEGELKRIAKEAAAAAKAEKSAARTERKAEIEKEKAAEAAYKAGPCGKKNRYTNWQSAVKSAVVAKKRNRFIDLEPYKCNCGNIHLQQKRREEALL